MWKSWTEGTHVTLASEAFFKTCIKRKWCGVALQKADCEAEQLLRLEWKDNGSPCPYRDLDIEIDMAVAICIEQWRRRRLGAVIGGFVLESLTRLLLLHSHTPRSYLSSNQPKHASLWTMGGKWPRDVHLCIYSHIHTCILFVPRPGAVTYFQFHWDISSSALT